jgi:hypothetical protein
MSTRDPRIDPQQYDIIVFDEENAIWTEVHLVNDRNQTVSHWMNDGRYLVSSLVGWREFAKTAVKAGRGDDREVVEYADHDEAMAIAERIMETHHETLKRLADN